MKLQDTLLLTSHEATIPLWQSPEGNLLDIHFLAQFPLTKISSRPPNLWRYREAIPILSDVAIVSLNEGFTPLLNLTFNGNAVGVKQEQLFSTGSYKDRGATVLMSKVKELGIQQVVQDSSGNAGCAIAAYAAAASVGCTIYLQQDTSPAKIAQMKAYGAHIEFVNGSREDVAEVTLKAARAQYYASHSWNPFFFQGTKTFAYEVCEQLGWQAPDSVVLPAGNGTLVIGCYIGFMDLLHAGIIDKMPKLIAVQSEHCAPLAAAFANNQTAYTEITSKPTIAEGIAIAKPIRGNQILQYVTESKGSFITVTEAEIKAAWKDCAAKGFYIEPTSAATIAGLMKYMEGFPNEKIVSLFSGHGLKSTDKILTMV
ncbi:MAG: threonine synthase [Bacteroidota bacterium]